MRKNDYHVVAYSILSYLYDCLKQGEEVRDDFIRLEWYPVKLPTSYRWFIYNGLSEMGYIDTIGWGFKRRVGIWRLLSVGFMY